MVIHMLPLSPLGNDSSSLGYHFLFKRHLVVMWLTSFILRTLYLTGNDGVVQLGVALHSIALTGIFCLLSSKGFWLVVCSLQSDVCMCDPFHVSKFLKFYAWVIRGRSQQQEWSTASTCNCFSWICEKSY